jgi:hypothetical protein
MTREYARGPRGGRVHGYVPRNRGTVTTMIGAMGIDGVRAMMTVEGATDAEVFEAFVTHLLVPKLKPANIVVLENVGAHKPEGPLARIRAAGARVLFSRRTRRRTRAAGSPTAGIRFNPSDRRYQWPLESGGICGSTQRVGARSLAGEGPRRSGDGRESSPALPVP